LGQKPPSLSGNVSACLKTIKGPSGIPTHRKEFGFMNFSPRFWPAKPKAGYLSHTEGTAFSKPGSREFFIFRRIHHQRSSQDTSKANRQSQLILLESQREQNNIAPKSGAKELKSIQVLWSRRSKHIAKGCCKKKRSCWIRRNEPFDPKQIQPLDIRKFLTYIRNSQTAVAPSDMYPVQDDRTDV
jgi:hypothetical protein